MKFKFCGDLDAPEWLLREVATLSRMTYVRIKLLILHIMTCIETNSALDMEKVHKFASTAKFDASDLRGTLAAIRFVVRSATRHAVAPKILNQELCQIGLPGEHARAFERAFVTHEEALRKVLAEETLRLPRVDQFHWRSELTLSAAGIKQLNTPMAQIKLVLSNGKQCHFALTADKLRVLLAELHEAHSLISQ